MVVNFGPQQGVNGPGDLARGAPLNLRTRRGEEVWQSKLTEERVREIRASDASLAELARRFNVSTETIRSARNGRRWAHVQ